MNLFTGTDGLPAFEKIKPNVIEKTIKDALATARTKIDKLAKSNTNPTWENFSLPLSELDDYMHKILDPVGHLRGVQDSDELREAYEACIPELSEFSTFVGQHTRLSNRYNEFRDSEAYGKLSIEQKKSIDDSILGFTLSGINLDDDAKERFGKISEELSILTNEFSKNSIDATQHWTKHITDVEELDGVPNTALEVLEQAAKDKDLEGYLITLDYPNFSPIMDYCTNRELRKEIALASSTKASDTGPDADLFNNAPLMDRILELKFERAKLLGYENFAEKSVVTKMADNTQEVLDFLVDLKDKAKQRGIDDHNELKTYAEEVLGLDKMESYDVAFISEKIMKEKYDVDSEEVRKYFPHTTVVPGMFEVVKTLYGIEISEREGVDVWHEDVKFYDIFDGGKLIASFYLDMFARSDKRSGAWMGDCLIRWTDEKGNLQLPVAYLTCNFTPPVGDRASLLTHTEVETLFHEFGHGLHHMLTKVEAYDVSGINGVEWDAVEQPSQIMENWCWNKEALTMFSGHFETGDPIPDDLFDKMLAAKNFLSGKKKSL